MTNDKWQTPKALYESLDAEFHFDHDPCPITYKQGDQDGLSTAWGKSNFINPPYSRGNIPKWIRKSIEVMRGGAVCVMLLPADTSTAYYHDLCVPNAREIRFLRGRLHFSESGPARFGSMVVVFR